MWWKIRECTNSVISIIYITLQCSLILTMEYTIYFTSMSFFEGTSIKLRCSVFHLLTPACSSKLNNRIISPPTRNLPRPSSHLTPSPRGCFGCPYSTVPGASLNFSTCYTVLYWIVIVCHFSSPLRLRSSRGQKTTLLPVVSRRPRPSRCLMNTGLINGVLSFPFRRCWCWRQQMHFYLTSNSQIPQISIPSHMTILL